MSSPIPGSLSTQLDHIILLLSPTDFQEVPSWLSDNFSILDGGVHSKGTSQNKLILFKDGTYLELLSWVTPPPEGVPKCADFPGWAHKSEGEIIDWALTGNDAFGKFHDVTARLKELLSGGEQLNVVYEQPTAGGRRRMDGQELRWVTTRPRRLSTKEGSEKPDVPFFCHDVSTRTLRVPYVEGSIDSWPSVVTHPCGAVGVAGLTLTAPSSQLTSCNKLYEAILGIDSILHVTQGIQTYRFSIASPAQIADTDQPIQSSSSQHDNDKKVRSCCVELEGSPEEDLHRVGTRLTKLILRTETADRKGDRIDAGYLKTPIFLY